MLYLHALCVSVYDLLSSITQSTMFPGSNPTEIGRVQKGSRARCSVKKFISYEIAPYYKFKDNLSMCDNLLMSN